jgi:hypothetical protein
VAACKEGRKLEAQQAKSGAIAWFKWARRERIVIAMSGEVVYTPDGEAVALAEMMRRFPMGKYGCASPEIVKCLSEAIAVIVVCLEFRISDALDIKLTSLKTFRWLFLSFTFGFRFIHFCKCFLK